MLSMDHAQVLRELGQRILRARLDLGSRIGRNVTQTEVAAAMGVTGAAISTWESGIKGPSRDRLLQLATILGVRAGWLAFGEEPMHYGDAEQTSMQRRQA